MVEVMDRVSYAVVNASWQWSLVIRRGGTPAFIADYNRPTPSTSITLQRLETGQCAHIESQHHVFSSHSYSQNFNSTTTSAWATSRATPLRHRLVEMSMPYLRRRDLVSANPSAMRLPMSYSNLRTTLSS